MRHSLALAACAVILAGGCESLPSTKIETGPQADSDRWASVLGAQPEDVQARYGARHPQQTLEFFGIAPGMTVVEALPGGGWYTKLLLPYLGQDGALIGVDYAFDMWPRFGIFDDKFIEAKKTWATDWTAQADGWRAPGDAPVSAFVFGSMPRNLSGQADAVLFIRALHNLNRFEKDGEYLTTAINDAWRVLKPGGIVGVVQHEVDNSYDDAWADGSRGYLKRSRVIAAFEARGFEFVDGIPVNANPKDRPGEADMVWRLPPVLITSREDPALREQMLAIGESNRMTLKFRKPR